MTAQVRRFGGALTACLMLAAGQVSAAQTAVPAPRPLVPTAPTAPRPTPAPAAAYPARQVLDAFRTACSKLDTLPVAERQVVASGWAKVADPATTPVAKLVAYGQAAGADMLKKAGGRMQPMAVFAHSIAGEQLYLVLSGVTLDGRTVTGCRLYDVDESRRIAPDEAAAWLGRKPTQTTDQSELTRTGWEPGMLAGQDSFEVYHVPAGSPVIAMTQLAGIALKADRVKGAK